MSNLRRDAHSGWLKNEEIEQVSGLGAGKVWIRQNDTGKSVTAKIKESMTEIGLAHQLRTGSVRGREIVSVRQMSSAFAEIDGAYGTGNDLYHRLCDKEALRLGMLGRGFQPEIGAHGFLKTRSRKQLALCFSKNWSKKILWRSRRLEPTAILAQQARSVAKLFNREGEYHPYKMRW